MLVRPPLTDGELSYVVEEEKGSTKNIHFFFGIRRSPSHPLGGQGTVSVSRLLKPPSYFRFKDSTHLPTSFTSTWILGRDYGFSVDDEVLVF